MLPCEDLWKHFCFIFQPEILFYYTVFAAHSFNFLLVVDSSRIPPYVPHPQ